MERMAKDIHTIRNVALFFIWIWIIAFSIELLAVLSRM
jgi:hypothetical protein